VSFDDLPLARAAADRAAHLRTDPDVLARALADPHTRVLLVGDGSVVTVDPGERVEGSPDGVVCTPTGARADVGAPNLDGWGRRRGAAAPTAIAYLDPRAAAAVGRTLGSTPDGNGQGNGNGNGNGNEATRAPSDEDWLLLGRTPVLDADADGPLVLALRVPQRRPAPRAGESSDVLVHQRAGAVAVPSWPALPPGLGWSALRVVGGDLDATDAGLATTAVALDAWHARHVRCPRCGASSRVTQAGWVRVCTADGSEHYPRTDPAVIMAVVDDEDRLLLGHAAAWAPGRFSTLAGFVEAGESAEHAVRREVREETAVEVDRVEYRGSQPWPFPASLMLAFRAHAATTQVRVDDEEVTDARWFSRAELAAAVHGGEVVLPGPASIAHALIEDWYGAPLPAPPLTAQP